MMVIAQKEANPLDFHQFQLLDLSHLFEKVLRIWGLTQVRHLGPSLDPLSYLPLERMVTLSGAVKGFLVIRSTREFALWLRSQRENTILGRYPEEEIFEELISLFCLYMVHSVWKPQLFTLDPVIPFPSIPGDWPADPPRSSALLCVGEFPVEIRLWVEP